MITKENAAWAMAQGVGFACAMCDNLWWGVERGTGCKAQVSGTFCAGPIGGGAFPQYKGPLKGRLQRWCFVCGHPSTHLAEVHGKGGVGICDNHIEMLDHFSVEGVAPPVLKPIPVDLRK